MMALISLAWFLMTAIICISAEMKSCQKVIRGEMVEMFDPGPLQYLVKPGDFLGFSKISNEENGKLQKLCGRVASNNVEFKVAMGKAAHRGEFPWVVALGQGSASCTGTIISSRHVLTATHCLAQYESASVPCTGASINTNPATFTVNYGGVCLYQDRNGCPRGGDMKTAKVRKAVFPHAFHADRCILGGDIAILELEEDLVFDAFTRPICVGYVRQEDHGQMFDLGFGRDEHNRQVANLRYIVSEDLQKVNGHHESIVVTRPTYSTVLGSPNRHPGMCKGDSGGPFQVNVGQPPIAYIHGIHSYGTDCGNSAYPHSSTNVLVFLDFICEITGVCRDEIIGKC